jgi:hypothetical protein
MRAPKTRLQREAGIALLTTILLMLLMSSLLIGFVLLITQGQKMSGLNNDYSRAFYGSEAGMEKLTADLGTLFDKNYAPTAAQLAAISAAPPSLANIQYLQFDGTSGYKLDYPGEPGTPVANITTIKSGTSPYQGMTALATPYTLTVTARTQAGTEVKLQRTTQTVGIPMFQFGVFCDGDCSFFPGPNFNFGGRTHTNGNLFLAAGSTLWLSDKVTAVKNIIRTNLSNGFPTTTGQYAGIVDVTTSPGSASYRALAYTEGSLVGTIGSAANPNWPTISQGYYNSNIVSGAKPLNLGIVTLGTNTKPVDIIRRPPPADATIVTQQRYFAQASVHIVLSDNPADIMNMPCIDPTTQPFELRKLAQPYATLQANPTGDPQLTYLKSKLGVNLVPLANSGAGAAYSASSQSAPAGDGYWLPAGTATTPGFLKIEVQTSQGTPCGGWQDVTLEVLGLGYVGRNINPVGAMSHVTLPSLPVAQMPAQNTVCAEPFPNAIVRLERIRDNPGTTGTNPCGITAGTIVNTAGNDFWPMVLFDTREGTLRDAAPAGSIGAGGNTINYAQMVTPGGVMHYVEIDAGNLSKWLSGATAGSGHLSYDPVTAPNDYTLYFSDRRGNWVNGATLPGPWPPLSFSQNETGEYGFEDFVNSSTANGCPDRSVETAEDLDTLGAGVLFTYGQDPGQELLPVQPAKYLGGTPWTGGYGPFAVAKTLGTVTFGALANVFAPYVGCNVTNNPSGSPLWPGIYIIHANEARENPTFFFRRAMKIVNGSLLQTGACPGTSGGTTINCGLTIAAENPIYVQGDFNSNSAGNGWNDAHVAVSIVGDAVTLLSNNWNDVNSFTTPYCFSFLSGGVSCNTGANRAASSTWYRAAIVAGKGLSFTQPTGYATSQDFGTDGGVHNFLRYIENWGGQTLNYEGSMISLFTAHQAIGVFKCCTTVYSPPTRNYSFDAEFLQPQLLPPRTPLFRDVNTTGFTQLLLPQQ